MTPGIDLSPSFDQVVNPVTQFHDDSAAEETRKTIFRGFRMWSIYHKPRDDWFLQRHHFLSLTTELRHSVLAQGGKPAQYVRASPRRRYPQLPGKVSQDAGFVAVDPRSTAWHWAAAPLASLKLLPPILPECPSTSVRYMWAVKYVRLFFRSLNVHVILCSC